MMPDGIRDSRFGLAEEDWRVLAMSRANILLVGPEPLTSQVVDALRPGFGEPIARWLRDEGGGPPCPCATLLLTNADQLTLPDQQRVDEFLLAGGSRSQVVTISSAPLFPLVEQGRFLARLYYRLNVVYLALEGAG